MDDKQQASGEPGAAAASDGGTPDGEVAADLDALAEADPGDAPEIAERLAAALGDALDRERADTPPR